MNLSILGVHVKLREWILAGAFLDKQMSMVMGHDLYYTVLNYKQMS